MKVIKKVFEKISGQKIFSPQISRKKIFNRKIFTYKPGTIQATLMIAFSVVSAVILLCMGSVMYLRFSSMSQKEILENNQWKCIYVSDELMGDCKVIHFPKSYQTSKLRLNITRSIAPPAIYEINVIHKDKCSLGY